MQEQQQRQLAKGKGSPASSISYKDLLRARNSAKRMRAHNACAFCKSRKAKCNDYRPCKRCVNTKHAQSCIESSKTKTCISGHYDGQLQVDSKLCNISSPSAVGLREEEDIFCATRPTPLLFEDLSTRILPGPKNKGFPSDAGSGSAPHVTADLSPFLDTSIDFVSARIPISTIQQPNDAAWPGMAALASAQSANTQLLLTLIASQANALTSPQLNPPRGFADASTLAWALTPSPVAPWQQMNQPIQDSFTFLRPPFSAPFPRPPWGAW
jgi:hypothetical protein